MRWNGIAFASYGICAPKSMVGPCQVAPGCVLGSVGFRAMYDMTLPDSMLPPHSNLPYCFHLTCKYAVSNVINLS
eukprot:scaffold530476_cov32-Prasinocladus_malaysianus.AAC.1